MEWVTGGVLEPVPHCQLVWTIPKVLRPALGRDRKLLGELSRCAWRSLRLYLQHALGSDTVPAAVLAIQTYGDQLNFHPHLHSLVAEGGWGRDDGTFQSVSWLDSDILSAIFRQQVLEMMVHTGRVTTRDSASTKALNSSYQGESASSSICGSYQADSSASSARVLPLSLDRATLHAEQHASQHQRPCEVHRGLR